MFDRIKEESHTDKAVSEEGYNLSCGFGDGAGTIFNKGCGIINSNVFLQNFCKSHYISSGLGDGAGDKDGTGKWYGFGCGRSCKELIKK